jgi:hypothetical protein
VDKQALFEGLQRGRVEMDAIRQILNDALREEVELLAQRDRQRRDTENLEISFAIGAGVLSLGIMLMAAALLVRNNVRPGGGGAGTRQRGGHCAGNAGDGA